MTALDRPRPRTGSHDRPSTRTVILHVAESWGAGTRAAALQFVAATPEFEHHLLRGTRRSEYVADAESVFASVSQLPAGAFAAIRRIREVVKAIDPDVVHAHSSYAGMFVRGAIRSTASRRVVYSPHCFAFERRDLSPLARTAIRTVERVLAGNTDAIAACSPAEAVSASRLVRRSAYVPNVSRVDALAMLEHRDPGRVVGLGRIGAQKDPDFFRAVVARLRVRVPGVDPRWIGDGDDAAARQRLEVDRIPVSGWLPSFEAHRALGGAGLYLHTARWEGFPVSILEAVELGVPVIAREVPTIAGAIATPGLQAPEQMAQAAEKLLLGGEEARRENLAAWHEVLAANTTEQQRESLRALYRPTATRPLRLNGKWLASQASGMQRYAGEVARRVMELDPTARVIVPRDAELPDWLPADRVERARLRGIAFEQLELPWRARRTMLVNLAGPAPLVKRDQLVVMHDVTPARFPTTFSKRFVLWYSFMYRVLATRARHLATVSEFSRGELADVLGVAPSRFAIAPNGYEHALDAAREAQRMPYPADDDYVLCIGNLTPSKNLAPVTRALAAAGIRVVVVGAAGKKSVFTEQGGLEGSGIQLAGRLSDAELAQLLRHAKALVFPSLYEGFGLPVVEAQALSCPVIASDAASIPEVAGEGAVYFDPTHPEQAVQRVRALDDAGRERLIERGHRNVERFSWDRTAATILGLATDAPVAQRVGAGSGAAI